MGEVKPSKSKQKFNWRYFIAEMLASISGFIAFFFLVPIWGDFSEQSLDSHYSALGICPEIGGIILAAGIAVCVVLFILCGRAENGSYLQQHLFMEAVTLGFAGYMFSARFWAFELGSQAVGSEILGFALIVFDICFRIATRKHYYISVGA